MGITEISSASAALTPQVTGNRPAAPVIDGAGDSVKSAQSNVQSSTANNRQARPEELESSVAKIQQFVSATTSDVQFSIDKDSGSTVVKVIDRNTKEVIRQIPSQEMLDMAKALDRLQGLLLKNQA